MTHPTPVLRAYWTAQELGKMLATCLSLQHDQAADRLCCLHAFTRLRAVCELWANDPDPDAFEEYYLLLFDALGFMTTAWQCLGERRRMMAYTVEKLDAIKALYHNS